MHEQYEVGETTTVRAVFFDGAGTLADPATVALTITSPSGIATTYTYAAAEITRPSVGHFEKTITNTAAGVWAYRFVSTGTPSDIQDGVWLVGRARSDGPCDPWCSIDSIFTVPPLTSIAAVDRDYASGAEAVDASSRLLFRLSGFRYTGICRATVRPCRRSTYASPSGWNSSWGACGCGASDLPSCGCSGLSEVRLLGEHPIVGIRQVRVDGEVLPASSYRVDNARLLVRIDGDVWPSCQDLAADPATDPNTWDVDVYFGTVVPPDGTLAARLLAAQLYAGQHNMECSLPATIRSRSYQGVEEEIITLSDLEDGKFGIREVDWFLNAEVQAKKRRPALVASPDFLPDARRTGTA